MNFTPLKKTAPHENIAYVKTLLSTAQTVHTMLLHDGFLETALLRGNHTICSHTQAHHVYNFWHCLATDSNRLHQTILNLDKRTSSDISQHYDYFRETWTQRDDQYMKAALFFLVSISSDQGTISRGKIERNAAKNFLFGKVRAFQKNERWHFAYHHERSLIEQIKLIDSTEKVIVPAGFYNYDFLSDAKRYGPEQTPVVHQDLKQLFQEQDNIILSYFYHPDLLELHDHQNFTMIDINSNITHKESECCEVVLAKS